MEKKHMKYLTHLDKIASAMYIDENNKARIASCIVYKNEIVSVGVNQMKSHPFQQKYARHTKAIFLHSETDCIKNALKVVGLAELSRSTLYVCRVKYTSAARTNLIWGLSKPCKGCQMAIAAFDIPSVIFSLDNGGYGVM